MYASIFEVDVHKLRKELWEENFFLEKTMEWSKSNNKRFFMYVLNPIYIVLFDAIVNSDKLCFHLDMLCVLFYNIYEILSDCRNKWERQVKLEQPQHGEGIQPDKDYGDGKKVVMELVRITDTWCCLGGGSRHVNMYYMYVT